MFNGEIMFHLKRILYKRLLYYKWKARYKLLLNSGLKEFCARFYKAQNILFRGTKYLGRKQLCNNALKTNWKFIYPWSVVNWHVFQIAKSHFSYTIWCTIFSVVLTRSKSINKAQGKTVYPNFQNFQTLNYLHVD